MSSPTHELSQTQLTITPADNGRQAATHPSLRQARTKTPDSMGTPAAHHPPSFLLIPLVATAACAVLMGALMVLARQSFPTPLQQEVVLWEQQCRQENETASNFPHLTSSLDHPGTVPGSFGFRAEKKLVTLGKLTLKDLILALGEPDGVGCGIYGILPGPTPVTWTRIVIGNEQVAAIAVLPYDAHRLSPDTGVHTLQCGSPNHPDLRNRTHSWQGFTSLAAYPPCPPSGTAVPR